MPRMIPEYPSPFTKSSAEKKLFSLLREMEGTEDWIVLHSVSIARHETQSQGEADFVIAIPSEGIYVLEVKGGLISQDNGKWTSTDRNGVEYAIKNPIEEANEAMHSIKDYLISNTSAREIGRSLFGFGVVFPDTSIHGINSTAEIADEQIADYDDTLTSYGLKQYLLRLSAFWKSRRAPIISLPTASQCKEIVQIIRPNFNGRVSLRSLIHNIENQVIELTENQQDTFDTITENDRCIVRGGAGTGKTNIALRFANQRADQGERTGFFCYNKQLAAYLQSHTLERENFICDSFTEFMEKTVIKAGKRPVIGSGSKERDEYYGERLPQLFMEAVLELDMEQLDNLVLDEAQDLITENYLEALDFFLKGGLKNGKWYFFMDAEKQNLYQKGTGEIEVLELIERYTTHYTKCYLRDNCRNSVAIIEKIDTVFKTQTRHRHNNERGKEVVIKSYRKTHEQTEILEKCLRDLFREGINCDEIVILSPFRFRNSAASLLRETAVTQDPEERTKAILFSTIHSYKGLESPVVILTDIDSFEDEARMNILYVGMTRARIVLYILAREDAAKQMR